MCCMPRFTSLIAVIPISFLLALSFFVLISIDKTQAKRLKTFGKMVVVIIWLAVLVIILGAIHSLGKDGDQKKCTMHKEMMMRMDPGMSGMPMGETKNKENIK